MSDQDMQFADPDWQPTSPMGGRSGAQGKQEPATPVSSASSEPFQPRPVNDAWREQNQVAAPGSQAEPYQRSYDDLPPYAGYPGTMPAQQPSYEYQGQQMRYRRRRRTPLLWIILIVLLVSLLGGFGSLGSIGQKNVIKDNYFNVTGTPTIVLHETNGNVHVQQGSRLDIQTNKQAGWFDDPNNIQVNFKQDGSIITVDANTAGPGFLSERSVDFTITVPQNVNLQLQTNSGDISVDNIAGQATLSTASGDISAADDQFAAESSLQTASGDVKTQRDTFGDNTTIATQSGDISLDNAALQGSEKFNTTSGNIQFNGTVTPGGNYQFNAISGDINIDLQQDVSFSVNAQTTSGDINSNDYPTIQVQSNNHGPGNSARGTVGSSPYAQFTLSTTSGDITIQHG